MLDIGVAPGQTSNGTQLYSKLLAANDSNFSNSTLGLTSTFRILVDTLRFCKDRLQRVVEGSGTSGEVEHGESAPDVVRLAVTGCEPLRADANLLARVRRASRAQ